MRVNCSKLLCKLFESETGDLRVTATKIPAMSYYFLHMLEGITFHSDSGMFFWSAKAVASISGDQPAKSTLPGHFPNSLKPTPTLYKDEPSACRHSKGDACAVWDVDHMLATSASKEIF